MPSTLSRQWLWIPARQCSVTPCKSDATVSTTEHSRLHSCWWTGFIFSRSISFRLLHLGYPAGFGVRRPTTSVCKSTGPQRGSQKQMEGGPHWHSSKIHWKWKKNDWILLESRMEARFSTNFSANRDWISILCSETCWTYFYFVRFGHPILFCVFRCQNKSA